MTTLRLAAIALALLILVACGGSTPQGTTSESETPTEGPTQAAAETELVSPEERLAGVREATQAAGSARFLLDQTISVEGLPGGGQTTSGEGAFTLSGTPSGHLTLSSPVFGELETRIVDDAVYLKFPQQLGRNAGLATPWVKVDLSDMEKAGQLGQMNMSPSSQLDLLDVLTDVEDAGEDVVRGDPVTHYTAQFSLRSLRDLPEASRAQLQPLQALGAKRIATDIWIDQQNRLRRLAMTIDLDKAIAASGGAGGGKLTQQFELYDFGTEVDVEAPPAGQVTDINDVPALAQAFSGPR